MILSSLKQALVIPATEVLFSSQATGREDLAARISILLKNCRMGTGANLLILVHPLILLIMKMPRLYIRQRACFFSVLKAIPTWEDMTFSNPLLKKPDNSKYPQTWEAPLTLLMMIFSLC